MDQEDRGRVLDRLGKLLALASSSNVHEAEVARRSAETFMLKHGVTEADVVADNRPGHYERPLGAKGWRSPWRFALVTLAARHCGAEAMATWAGGRRKVRLVGERPDVEAAHSLYVELLGVVTDLEKLAAERYAGDLVDLAGFASPEEAAESFRMGSVVGLAVLLGRVSGTRAPVDGGISNSDDLPETKALARVRTDYSRKVRDRYSPSVRSSGVEEAASPVLLQFGRVLAVRNVRIDGFGCRICGSRTKESS